MIHAHAAAAKNTKTATAELHKVRGYEIILTEIAFTRIVLRDWNEEIRSNLFAVHKQNEGDISPETDLQEKTLYLRENVI